MDTWWLQSLLAGGKSPHNYITSDMSSNDRTVTQLSEVGRKLMDYLYSFNPTVQHTFLEPYIVEFDRVMDRDDLIRALGLSIGLWIEVGRAETAADIFIDKLVDVITNLGELVYIESATLPIDDLPSVPYIVGMDRDQFRNWISDTNRNVEDILYQDRLYLLGRLVAEAKEKMRRSI